MSEPGIGHQGEPAYGVPFPPTPPRTYGRPTTYGQPVSPSSPQPYGPPVSAVPQPYGPPVSAVPQPYGPPVSAVPQPYGPPVSAVPQPYGPPVSAVPQPVAGSALQPYSPAAAPVPYPQAYRPQVAGPPLVPAGARIGAVLLDGLLAICTLWVGWLIWSMITWSDGQTPAKKLLGHVVADANTGAPFDWGQMALREFCIKGLLGWVLNVISGSIYFWVDSFMVFGERQRTLHDRMANSIVRYV